jgi:hypothetical protein
MCSLKGEKVKMSYDLNSAATPPKEEASIVNPLHTEQARILSARDNERQRKWFDSGVRAKKNNYGDLSPFYENKTADYFFKCGYAGTSFTEAQETLRSEIEQILKQDSTLSESVNELTK